MKKKISLLLIMCFLLVTACAPLVDNFPDTKPGKYASSLTFFNNTTESYYKVLALQNEETKAKWKETINPTIKAAGKALDLWGESVNEPSGITNEVAYLRLLQDMLIVLVELNIIEIGE